MTSDDTDRLDRLQESLRKAISTVASAYALLEESGNLVRKQTSESKDTPSSNEGSGNSKVDEGLTVGAGEIGDHGTVGLKSYILDSFHASNSVKHYKEWDHENTNSNNIPYNKTTGEIARLNHDINVLTGEYDNLKKSGGISLPKFILSKQTLLEHGNEAILRNLGNEIPSTVNLDQIYSVDTGSNLPFPDYTEFNQLANIEFKVKVQRKVQYEVLNQLRYQVVAENNKWLLREQELNDFFDNKLPEVISNVENIKANEYEVMQDVHDESEEEIESEDQEQENEHEPDQNENEHELEHEAESEHLKEADVQDIDIKDLEQPAEEANGTKSHESPQVSDVDSDEMLIDG